MSLATRSPFSSFLTRAQVCAVTQPEGTLK